MRHLPVGLPAWVLIAAFAFAFPAAFIPGDAEARSSFWISARDKNACIVSAVVQYDRKLEARVRQENEIDNAVLQMDINTKEPQELCSMLMMRQGDHRWRPLLCVTTIRGNIYSGYLILPQEFTLDSEVDISLGDRTIKADFLK